MLAILIKSLSFLLSSKMIFFINYRYLSAIAPPPLIHSHQQAGDFCKGADNQKVVPFLIRNIHLFSIITNPQRNRSPPIPVTRNSPIPSLSKPIVEPLFLHKIRNPRKRNIFSLFKFFFSKLFHYNIQCTLKFR